jgi:hypothetical protein
MLSAAKHLGGGLGAQIDKSSHHTPAQILRYAQDDTRYAQDDTRYAQDEVGSAEWCTRDRER